jgi:hypothetical protein
MLLNFKQKLKEKACAAPVSQTVDIRRLSNIGLFYDKICHAERLPGFVLLF